MTVAVTHLTARVCRTRPKSQPKQFQSRTSLIQFWFYFVLEESINEYRHEVHREC